MNSWHFFRSSKSIVLQGFCFFCLCMVVFAWMACSEQSKENEKQEFQDGSPILIGLSLGDLKEERWKKDRDYFVQRVKALGGEVIVQDAGGDPNVQVRQCEGLLAKGIKALVVIPKNAKASRPIAIHARKKGVKIISYDRLVSHADIDLYLSFDNVRVGEIQAKALVKMVPKGRYMILKGDPGDWNSEMIYKGHMRVLKPHILKGDIQVVVTQSCDKWLRSEARRITADALQKHKIDAIIASNDGTASGAISALIEKGLAGKVPVSGQDADLIACRYIAKGYQAVTVYKPIRMLAEFAAVQAVRASRGIEFDPAIMKLDNGKIQVPTVFLNPIPVTKENLKETVIKDRFHTIQDIFGTRDGNGI